MPKQIIIRQVRQPEHFQWVVIDPSGNAGPLEFGEGGIADLESALSAGEEGAFSVCYIPPSLAVTVSEIALNEEQRKYAVRMVPFLLEDQLIDDVNQLHFALNKKRDAVAIVNRQFLASQLQGMKSDSFSVDQCIPAPLLLPWQPDAWSLHYDGDNCLIRSGEKTGFAIDKSLLPLVLETAADNKSSTPATIRAFVEKPELHDELQALLPESLQANTAIDVQPLLQLASASMQSISLNMLQGQFASITRWSKQWRRWRLAVYAFAALLVLQTVVVVAEYWWLDSQSLTLRKSIEQIYREAFPNGVVVDPEVQMRRELQALRKTGDNTSFIAYYGQLGAVLDSHNKIILSSLNYDAKSAEIRLQLVADDYQTVEKLRADIVATGLNADLLNSNAQDDKVQARLRIKRDSGADL